MFRGTYELNILEKAESYQRIWKSINRLVKIKQKLAKNIDEFRIVNHSRLKLC